MIPILQIVPDNESKRLEAIKRYEILDTPPDGAFDRLTHMAVRIFKVPIAIISIVDYDRIWFKSHPGLDVVQIDRHPGLCASAILQDDIWLINDAKTDPRTLANPLVAGEFGLRFYAGVPLKTKDGFNLGTICLIDKKPRELSEDEKLTLEDLANVVMGELELRLAARETIKLERIIREQAVHAKRQAELLANTDTLTGLGNRRAFDRQLQVQLEVIKKYGGDFAVVMIDLIGLKEINDNHGHDFGDSLLITFARSLQRNFHPKDTPYRFGGDEYAIILHEINQENLNNVKEIIKQVVEQTREMGFPKIDASVGIATIKEVGGIPYKAVQLADSRMYVHKMEQYRDKKI